MDGKKEKVVILAFIILYLAANIWILCRIAQLKEYAGLLSLSYPAGGVAESAFDQWKENEDSGMLLNAAVWKKDQEQEISSKDTGHVKKVTCYQVKGQPGVVFGKELAEGRYFTEGEEDVCLLDEGTVHEIFGSGQVSGLNIQMDGDTFRIVGVLREDTSTCVVPARKDTVFDGIAVRKKREELSSNQTVSLIEASLGSAQGQRVDGQLYYVTAWLFYAGVTAVILALVGGRIRRYEKTKYKISIGCVLCAALAAGILILGVKSARLGSDYLPTFWSDFDFFGRLFKEKAEQIQSLVVRQEFAVWQRMLHIWRQIIGAEILSAGMAAALCRYIPVPAHPPGS